MLASVIRPLPDRERKTLLNFSVSDSNIAQYWILDVIAVPGPCYGYTYDSVYHAAVEGAKADILGILAYGFAWGGYLNRRWARGR